MADTEFSALSSTNTIAPTDQLLIVRGGVAYRFSGTLPVLNSSGYMTLGLSAGTTAPDALTIDNTGAGDGTGGSIAFKAAGTRYSAIGGGYRGAPSLWFETSGAERGRFDGSGNLLVGVTTGSVHTISKAGATVGQVIANFHGGTAIHIALEVQAVDSSSRGSSTATAARIGWNLTTGRSVNAQGTINASGADYAEYMTKAEGCGHIAKGQVCGVNAAGLLTLAWSEAIAFMVKSTDPNLVGGDSWDRHVGPRPEAPAPLRSEPVAPDAPEPFTEPTPEAEEGEDAGTFSLRVALWNGRRIAAEAAAAEHAEAMAAFADVHAAWETARNGLEVAQGQYEIELPEWEAAHEAARRRVDRIAYSGQVPVIVTGDFAPGDYIIAAEGPDDTIVAVTVPARAITFDQYRARIGKVLTLTEDDPEGRWPAGRAWVDVQHG